jgi:hypothetical protein
MVIGILEQVVKVESGMAAALIRIQTIVTQGYIYKFASLLIVVLKFSLSQQLIHCVLLLALHEFFYRLAMRQF